MKSSSFLGLGSPAEHLVFVQDEVEDSGNDFLSHDSTDSSTPWFLRVQELAHDSLIAATRAQLAKNAKASNNGRISPDSFIFAFFNAYHNLSFLLPSCTRFWDDLSEEYMIGFRHIFVTIISINNCKERQYPFLARVFFKTVILTAT